MTKPTGRPKGAPRKYESDDEKPFTVSVRVPRAWVQPLKRYATQHRQSMSELLLDGLRWRLSEGDPRGNGIALPPVGVETEKPYYENTDEGNMLVREVRELRAMLSAAVASGTLAVPSAPSRNTEIPKRGAEPVEPSASVVEPAPVAPPAPLEPPQGRKQCRKGHPPYDADKRECPHCVADRQRRKRQRQGVAEAR